jgi:hypothetical protein
VWSSKHTGNRFPCITKRDSGKRSWKKQSLKKILGLDYEVPEYYVLLIKLPQQHMQINCNKLKECFMSSVWHIAERFAKEHSGDSRP